MPSSAIEGVPYIIEYLRKHKPNLTSILDVGVGFGKFGYLLRDYFDAKTHFRFQPHEWKLQIIGVDAYAGYLSHIQRAIYTKIVIGDIFEVLPELGRFEVALLSDVIEHFSKEKGILLLRQLFDHVEDIVISTPLGFLPKIGGSVQINPLEQHLSGWQLEDFSEFYQVEYVITQRIRKPGSVLIVYLKKKRDSL